MTQSELADYQDSACIDHTDAETLQRLYWDEGQDLSDIAGAAEVAVSTVHYWMDKHGIERREREEYTKGNRRVEYANFRMVRGGYEVWEAKHRDGGDRVTVHELLAISEGEDPENVFGRENHVHHKNKIPWDNRPENIEVLTPGEHHRRHRTASAKLTENEVREVKQLLGQEMKQKDIADRFGIAQSTLSSIKHGDSWENVEIQS